MWQLGGRIMYENQYFGNPYFQSNAQRFPTGQYQAPMQQPIYQPQFQQNQPASQIVGRTVDSVEMIQANDVPMNAPYALFPKSDLSEIYLKSWNQNGTIQTVVFKPEMPKANDSISNSEVGLKSGNSELTEQIMRRLDELSAQIDEIGNSIPKTRTSKAKKDGDSE
jgi:hypothetical protein